MVLYQCILGQMQCSALYMDDSNLSTLQVIPPCMLAKDVMSRICKGPYSSLPPLELHSRCAVLAT